MSHVLEIARFKIKPEMESTFLEGRPAAMQAIQKRFPGLLSVHLVRFGDGDWADVAVWESQAAAQEAGEQCMTVPEFRTLMACIDEGGSMAFGTIHDTIARS